MGSTELTPVPVRETDCGLPLALSVIVREPVRVPVVVGANVALMEQLAPALTLPPQVLVSVYWPLTAILVRFITTLLEFVSVTL